MRHNMTRHMQYSMSRHMQHNMHARMHAHMRAMERAGRLPRVAAKPGSYATATSGREAEDAELLRVLRESAEAATSTPTSSAGGFWVRGDAAGEF